MVELRPARPSDAVALASIYNDALVNTVAIWKSGTVTSEERVSWLEDKHQTQFPVIVATDNDKVVGFATYGYWRPYDGYVHTVEHSVYVDRNSRGNGAGKAMLVELIQLARAQGKHMMVGCIESGNVASIKLHQKLGFEESGTFKEVGVKFGRWLDLTCLTLQLNPKWKL
ncbi:hypothetical protein PSN45_001384 [Yamadazyma tenuis]|uniref:Putative acetyltransferase protein n=1 Tax=Candida tenuis (strain ATCC 10573 / BCRC 21748 / CBS 615 / JCM 9827 / NBRC 10315 / NRRL Y-1498 / VKM Y-70) TaxID=590646 RepID=G3BCF7_CANTC|nr:putative acetyltransferase protein [Yamadazyma tenuis ATCC 10573]EGV60823.1 putative acetyltransferase protein [Yamadazyma tenuis ATCC 10573]WEJ93907.1 hypothetical protein PSN45_001384 [Yamadazyma tenuis]